MKRDSFVGGLLTATLATGLLLVGSTSASAQNTGPAPAQLSTGSTDLKRHATTVRPPVLSKARVTCGDVGAGVVAKLRNPNTTVQHYMVGAGDDNYVVTVAAHGTELVEFGCLPNGTYMLRVQNADGDFVAQTRVRVQCDATPPTGTPTATPTGTPTGTPTATPTGTPTGTPTSTPTASPSETPTTSPTTGTSSATTAVPSTPVGVPTAVEAGLPGPAAQDDSNHRRTIVAAGLLAAVAIMIGLASLLIRRRRGLHQL
ncbi:hypothetical protein EV643_110139 [Kribbella sp. VKM Ac-2527]|uniref:Uncharacterized protein n=1 Tax=Kribbella caucasensis TaxID=2512215 RepID=A0A4R6KF89_9ACTN|nr:hypothetical protein [Kribbella sp. VKM Ac-2527]TDO46756.1 hypothetical protein EV643_110139 [Kribbella sp. VKM Ac-2527]